MKLPTFLFAVSLLLAVQTSADVVLNEVVTLNGLDGFKSADGFAYDWIELHNTGDEAVDLAGYFLTDDPGILNKWAFGSPFVVAANGYATVFASDRNGVFEGETHTNFKLSSSNGDHLALVAPDGVTVRSQLLPRIPPLKQYVSFGRVEDGDVIEVLSSATPNAPNNGIAPVPTIASFSVSSAELKGGEEVTLAWQTTLADTVRLWSAPTMDGFFTPLGDPVSTEGTAVFAPTENTYYRLTAENTLGLREVISLVAVGASIHSFTITPATVVPGGRTILRWDSTGTGHTVDLNDGFGVRPSSPHIYTPWNELLIAKASEWKRAPSTPAPGWEQPDFDDSEWSNEAAPMSAVEQIYMRRTIELKDTSDLGGYSLRILAGSRFQVFVNGRKLGYLEDYAFAAAATPSFCELPIEAELLMPGANVIAFYLLSGTFDAALTAWRGQDEETVQTLKLEATNVHGKASKEATVRVLPLSFVAPPLPLIAVSEFFWSYQGTLPPEPYRFFELHNISKQAINLTGIQLAGSAIAALGSGAQRFLEADAYALVVGVPRTWSEELPIFGTFENSQAPETYHFGIDQALLDPFGRMFERFGYGYPGDIHGGPLETLQRIDESNPPTYPDNWTLSNPSQGTPGGPSFRFIEFVVTPETGRPGDTIEVYWKASDDVPLTLQLSESVAPIPGPTGSTSFVIPNDGRQPHVVIAAETEFGMVRAFRQVVLEPQIQGFRAESASIDPRKTVRMNWSLASTSINEVRIDPDIGTVRSPLEFVPLQIGGFFPKTLWRYIADGKDQGKEWQAIDFDDRPWGRRQGIFGYGNDHITTIIPNENFDWVTAYFRRHFDIPDATNVESLFLDLLFDDGVEVYINGIEVLRENLPVGEIRFDTPAKAQKGDDGRDYQEFQVDPSVLVDGDNVIAVGVHNRLATSEDLAFDLGLRAVRVVPPDGRANYTLTVTNAAGSASAVVTVLFDDAEVNVQDWALANGLVGDPATTDTDADGLLDAMEFAVGSDPLSPSPKPLSVDIDSDGHLELRFPSELHATGFDLELQISDDLQTWSPISTGYTYVSGTAAAGSSVVEHVYRSVIPPDGGTNYFRLHVREDTQP